MPALLPGTGVQGLKRSYFFFFFFLSFFFFFDMSYTVLPRTPLRRVSSQCNEEQSTRP